MDREESDQSVSCRACGAVIEPDASRGFAFGEHGTLCWECSIQRGGTYDSQQDRWTTPPDVSDLPDERRPHP